LIAAQGVKLLQKTTRSYTAGSYSLIAFYEL